MIRLLNQVSAAGFASELDDLSNNKEIFRIALDIGAFSSQASLMLVEDGIY